MDEPYLEKYPRCRNELYIHPRTPAPPQARLQYDTLDQDSIRLIQLDPLSTPTEIRCTMSHYGSYFDGTVLYTALSYCWGDINTTHTITINGCSFEVTTNLWHALCALLQYQDPTKRYWIDAICLNQSNVKERNHQVHQMWRIFSHAERVIAWLGPDTGNVEAAFSLLQRVAASCTSSEAEQCAGWKRNHAIPPEFSMAQLDALVNNGFFNRTWIIQEFVLGRQLQLLCGKHSLDGNVLFHFQKHWLGTQIGELVTNRWAHRREGHAETGKTDETALGRLRRIAGVLFTYSRSSCSDDRDKIYALLGDPVIRKLDPSMQMKPDYSKDAKTLAATFVQFCDMIITDRNTFEQNSDDISTESCITSIVYSICRALRFPCRTEEFSRYVHLSSTLEQDENSLTQATTDVEDGLITRYLRTKTKQQERAFAVSSQQSAGHRLSGYDSSSDSESNARASSRPGSSYSASPPLESDFSMYPGQPLEVHSPFHGLLMSSFSPKITPSSQKKHKCKICDKRFTRPSSLATHMYSHTGEKPFACDFEGCGRHFSVVSNLRRHRKVHQVKEADNGREGSEASE